MALRELFWVLVSGGMFCVVAGVWMLTRIKAGGLAGFHLRSAMALVIFLGGCGLWMGWKVRSVETIDAMRASEVPMQLVPTESNEPVEVPIEGPFELDGWSRQQVFDARRERVRKWGQLVSPSYEPSAPVFHEVEDGKPWWGLAGLYYYGPEQYSTEGLSEETRFLANPMMLVGVCENYAMTTIKGEGSTLPDPIPYPMPTRVRWQGSEVLVEYDLSSYIAFLDRWNYTHELSVTAYNARDLGLNYMALNKAETIGLQFDETAYAPFQIVQFIHVGGSCGKPGGCNNMSPGQPQLECTVLETPAVMTVHLWQKKPMGAEAKPDRVCRVVLNGPLD